MRDKLIWLAFGILTSIAPSDYSTEQKCELLRTTEHISKSGYPQYASVQYSLAKCTSIFLNEIRPTVSHINQDVVQSFHNYFSKLSNLEQASTYTFLGCQLNAPLLDISSSFPPVKDCDLKTLINSSTNDFYQKTDLRLTNFVNAATKPTGHSQLNDTKKRNNFRANVVENLMKARNLVCITPTGLRLQILAFIFGGRSKFVCELLSTQGAKGTYPIISTVLKNARESSYRQRTQ